MPLTVSREQTKAPQSSGTEALLRELQENVQLVTRVTIKYRAGTGGRPRKDDRIDYEITRDDERNAEEIFAALMDASEQADMDAGPCKFWWELSVLPPGEAEQITRRGSFRLDDDAGGGGELRTIVSTLERTNRNYDTLLGRVLGRLDEQIGLNGKLATAQGELLKANAEVMRVQYEHEERMAEHQTAADRADAELDLIKDLGPKWLMLQAAREARKDVSNMGGPKMPAWRRLTKIAPALLRREPVCQVLGESGVDLFRSLAVAKTFEEVNEIWAAFRQLCADGEIDLWALVATAPEVAAFADMAL